MDEEMIDVEILRLMNEIADNDYGCEKMDKLQRQLHSLQDLKAKLPKKRKVRDWFWENSKPLIAAGTGLATTMIVISSEHLGPILSKAFAFIPKPKI